MKLITAIISTDDSNSVIDLLAKNGYQVTRLATTGGFLRAGNTTLIIGCEDEKVDLAIKLIGQEAQERTEYVPTSMSYDVARYNSFPIEVHVGGATIFVSNIEKFVKL